MKRILFLALGSLLLGSCASAPDLEFQRGRSAQGTGELREAIVAYRKAIARDARDQDAWFNLGVALQDTKQNKEAAVAYEKVLEIDPLAADAWINRGRLYQLEGKSEEARRCFERASAQRPWRHFPGSGSQICSAAKGTWIRPSPALPKRRSENRAPPSPLSAAPCLPRPAAGARRPPTKRRKHSKPLRSLGMPPRSYCASLVPPRITNVSSSQQRGSSRRPACSIAWCFTTWPRHTRPSAAWTTPSGPPYRLASKASPIQGYPDCSRGHSNATRSDCAAANQLAGR
jgi:tetratricopeptide (TPR) repeat protein